MDARISEVQYFASPIPIFNAFSMDVALLPTVVFFVPKKSQLVSEVRKYVFALSKRKLTLAITYTIEGALISFLPRPTSSLRLRPNVSHNRNEQVASSSFRYCSQNDSTTPLISYVLSVFIAPIGLNIFKKRVIQ